MTRSPLLVIALGLAACQDEVHPKAPKDVAPPADSPESIPDAPLTGSIRGVPFKLGDARVVVDHRVNYLHTDIKLSGGSSEAACGEIKPKTPTSIWLRLEGDGKIEPGVLRFEPGKPAGGWSIHYQVRDAERWTGSADGAAILRIRAATPDGLVVGDLAVCFGDGEKSCVMGTFSAPYCRVSLDEAVRGTLPVEAPPPLKSAAPSGSAAAAPADAGAEHGGPSHKP